MLLSARELPATISAQVPPSCAAVSVPAPRQTDLLFTPEQEVELGRIIKSEAELTLRIIDDPLVADYLREVGDRIVAVLPSPGVPFEFALADLPEATALALPGGAVFVSSKLVGMLRSEGELAAVLAHEVAHIAARHAAADLSRAFRRVLGIDGIGTASLFDRYHELIESGQNIGVPSREDADQEEADRVGVELLAAAGYEPAALGAVFERLSQLRRGRGNWLSDLFGSTPPNAKRLRVLAAVAGKTPSCRTSEAVRPAASFLEWQRTVLHYRGIGSRESLPGLIRRTTLQPSLRNSVGAIRISRDGRYVLAQDESSIAVFLREGLRPLFRIEADDAKPATFSPDSQRVSVLIQPLLGSPRVERWLLPEGTADVHEIHVASGCAQSALSPDGQALLCLTVGNNYNNGMTFDLRIIAVETEEVLLERKPFVTIDAGAYLLRALGAVVDGDLQVVGVGFTPDSRYVIAGNEAVAAGFDLRQRKSIDLGGGVKRLARGMFVFMDERRLAGRVGAALQIVSFPEGTTIVDETPIGNAVPSPVARGDYLILGPLKGGLSGVVDPRSKRMELSFPQRAADVFEDVLVREREDGRLVVQALSTGAEIVTASMPDSRLGRLRAAAISVDGRWLAASGRTRGGVWDLENQQRVLHLVPFDSAWLGERNALHAVMRENGDATHAVVRFDLLKPPAHRRREMAGGQSWLHSGRVVLVTRPANPGDPARDVTIEARDVDTDAVRWSKRLARDASSKLTDSTSGTLVLVWPLADRNVREAIQRDAAWQQVLRSVGDPAHVVGFEVIDSATGVVRGRVPVDGRVASLTHARAVATTDRLFVLEGRGRLLAYSYDGALRGRMFARAITVSPDGRRVAVETARGRLVVLDTGTLERIGEWQFASTIALVSFGHPSATLLVLTSDQTLHTVDLAGRGAAGVPRPSSRELDGP